MNGSLLPEWSRWFRPLQGVRVAEVGDAVATAVAGWVLRALGASVTHLQLRKACTGVDNSQPFTGNKPVSSVGRTLRLLHEGAAKVTITERGQILQLLDGNHVDLVLFDASGGLPLADGSATVSEYLKKVSATSVPAWVTVAPFGLSGPLAGQPADELITLAASGLLHYTRGSSGEYVVPAGFQAGVATGHLAALAAVDALGRAAESRQQVHFEVSCQEAVIATSVLLEVAHVLYGLDGEPGTGRYGPPRGLLPCADGHLYLSILEDHHWRRLRSALGNPPWARGIDDLAAARSRGAEIMTELERWASTRTREATVPHLQSAGVPATAVYSCWELLEDRDYIERGFIDQGAQPLLPKVPFLARASNARQNSPSASADEARMPRPAWHPRPLRSMRGCRVADLSHVLAGPLATSWLGAMGADVVRLEERHRLDIYRRRGPRPPRPWPPEVDPLELSGYFAVSNHSKRSVVIDDDKEPSLRRRLLAEADVVVENMSAHRRIRLGLDFDTFRQGNRRAVMISSSGFGRSGSRAHYRVYGTNLHCHSGIVYHTRDAAGNVCNIGTAAWADPITSIWIALLASASYQTGILGADFDLSMAEVATRHLFDHLAVAAVSPAPASDHRPPIITERPPHAIVPAHDGDVMVVLASEVDYLAFRRFWPQLAPSNSKWPWPRAASHALDALAACGYDGKAHDLVTLLHSQGLQAHRVHDADSLVCDPHLAARGFFTVANHPVWGKQRTVGVPWRVAGEGPLAVGPTPLLGEHHGWRQQR